MLLNKSIIYKKIQQCLQLFCIVCFKIFVKYYAGIHYTQIMRILGPCLLRVRMIPPPDLGSYV